MPNNELTVENDEMQNSSDKHENKQTIPKHDLTWYDTDSVENELYSSDENDE